jgi:hypothetical protein
MSERSEAAPMENDHPPFDVRAVLDQFRSGQIPASLHVYRARRRSLVGAGIALIFPALIIAALAIFLRVSTGFARDTFTMMTTITCAVMAALAGASALLGLRGIREQAVIITPAGFLIRTDGTVSLGQIVAPSMFAVPFSELRNLNWTTQGWLQSVRDTLREAITSQAVMRTLILDYPDLRRMEFQFPARFGPSHSIVKDVIAAYESWKSQQTAIK